ncbi:MAG: zf-TFIIB domain-containing protein [Parasphingopyxis sp.]|uniref:TFIIB-type zinc ribbon-containing protein n=1 Tax=Parasphingopyxis sp. TaxID=1920299 RepID=UPI002618B30F|nr:zf-TFIIB domain-containing protein [uncultured Parasphingopyxis sp.]
MRDEATVSSMLCPVCKTGLALSDRQGVEIDYCPQCRGVWLDRGELDKIIERNSEQMQQMPGSGMPARGVETVRRPERGYYGDDDRGYRGGGHHGQRRKRSFLSDFFD